LLFINIFNLQHCFLTGYGSWTWAEPNWAFCGDAHAKWRPLKGGATVCEQPCSTLCRMFVQPFSFVSYYFLELNLMILVFISRRHITAGWERDTGTILRPTGILIRIYGWRQDRLVNAIEIGCMDSLTLSPRTYWRPVVSKPLGARNQYRAPGLRSSRPCKNIRLISPKNMNDSQQIMKNSAAWS
jgi:hypothetical protein